MCVTSFFGEPEHNPHTRPSEPSNSQEYSPCASSVSFGLSRRRSHSPSSIIKDTSISFASTLTSATDTMSCRPSACHARPTVANSSKKHPAPVDRRGR
eukprot:4944558-Pyramimonas_sp.AAC.1